MAHARFLVERVLMQIRAQVELKKSLASAEHHEAEHKTDSEKPARSRLLN